MHLHDSSTFLNVDDVDFRNFRYHLGKDDGTIGITFATWMAFNLPNVLVNIFLAWLFLIFKYLGWSRLMDSNARSRRERHQVRLYLDEEYKRLGPISHHEIGVLIVFLLVVVLWLLRDPQVFPGWGNIYEPFNTTNSGDSTAAMIGVLLLFIIPKDWSFLKPESKSVGHTHNSIVGSFDFIINLLISPI